MKFPIFKLPKINQSRLYFSLIVILLSVLVIRIIYFRKTKEGFQQLPTNSRVKIFVNQENFKINLESLKTSPRK